MKILNPYVCYRQGRNRRRCDTCEKETPNSYKRCFYYDPRKIPPREEQVCACGKTYHNFMSFVKHQINCETVFLQRMGKLLVTEDGGPVAINTKVLTVLSKKSEAKKPWFG